MSDTTLLTELASAVKYLLETGARGGLDKATLETYAGRIDKALAAQAPKPAEAKPAAVAPPSAVHVHGAVKPPAK